MATLRVKPRRLSHSASWFEPRLLPCLGVGISLMKFGAKYFDPEVIFRLKYRINSMQGGFGYSLFSDLSSKR